MINVQGAARFWLLCSYRWSKPAWASDNAATNRTMFLHEEYDSHKFLVSPRSKSVSRMSCFTCVEGHEFRTVQKTSAICQTQINITIACQQLSFQEGINGMWHSDKWLACTVYECRSHVHVYERKERRRDLMRLGLEPFRVRMEAHELSWV